MKRVLMIAYHFPPLAGSSGIQRTLRFVQHLPAFGWEALVLTTHPRAYERTSSDLEAQVPAGTVVCRAFALDTARHLAFRGRYPGVLARPDRWLTWKFDAIRQGLRMIRRYRPDAIWSTYPIATAHLIGSALHGKSGLPWVADFRDPMAQVGYPPDPQTWNSFKRIEEDAAREASRWVFTTPGAARAYRERYPDAAGRMSVIENGYDEESFSGRAAISGRGNDGRPILLLHSGIVYPQERNPEHLFAALRQLRQAARLSPADLRIRFRAAVHDDFLRASAAAHGVAEFIEICPPIAYRDALAEMLGAQALLVLQDAGCNDQIPAKLYEYLRAGLPVLGLTDPAGDTAWVMRQAGLSAIARLEDAGAIAAVLVEFVGDVRAGRAARPAEAAVAAASRRGRAESLAALLDGLKR